MQERTSKTREYLENQIIDYAKRFIGVPYNYKENDCSAFICEILKAFGVIPWNSNLNSRLLFEGLSKKYFYSKLEPCSLLFFSKNGEISGINHVSMAVDKNFMIEAGGGDSSTNETILDIRSGSFIRIRPISLRISSFHSSIKVF